MLDDIKHIIKTLLRIIVRQICLTPWRFGAALLVGITLIVIIGTVVKSNHSTKSPTAIASSSASPVSVPVDPTSTPTMPSVSSTSIVPVPTSSASSYVPQVYPSALRAATLFATAWTNAHVTQQQWIALMRPYATDEWMTAQQQLGPAFVPCGALQGPAQPGVTADGMIQVIIPAADCPPMQLTLIQVSGTWRVSDVVA